MAALSASVGLGGINHRYDVMVVQRLLTQAGCSPGPIDGLCGRRTMAAIERFQHGLIAQPDGRVDVNGPTFRRLRTAGQPVPSVRSSSPASPAPVSRPTPSAQPAPARSSQSHPNSFWTGHTALPSPDVNRGLTSPTSAHLTALLWRPYRRPGDVEHRDGVGRSLSGYGAETRDGKLACRPTPGPKRIARSLRPAWQSRYARGSQDPGAIDLLDAFLGHRA